MSPLPGRFHPHLVESAERFADGQLAADELKALSHQLHEFAQVGILPPTEAAVPLFSLVAAVPITYPAMNLANVCSPSEPVLAVIRDLFPDPSLPPVKVPKRWRTTTVTAIARGAYDDRAFDRLPVLADALEDAGCDSEPLLAHLRAPEPHVRGCWALDAVLGLG